MGRTKVMEFIEALGDGGAENLVKDYALMLSKDKCNVFVCVVRNDGTRRIENILRDSCVDVIKLLPDWYTRTLHFITRNFRKFEHNYVIHKRLDEVLYSEQPDVIHIHLELLKYIVRSRFVAEKNVKLVYTCHSVPNYHLHGEELVAIKKLIQNNNLQIVALHNDMKKEIDELLGITNTVVLRNAVDFKKFRSNINKDDERKSLEIPQDAFVLGHVGRFAESKNHKFLIDVFIEVARRKPNAYLLMIGDGQSKEHEKKLKDAGLEERYKVLVHRSDVHEIMKAMDVFVFPSVFEGLGLVAVEAQVSGLRCVMSDRVPKSAFLSENAVSLPLGNVQQWADVVLDPNAKGMVYGNLDDWDMNKEIIKLEKLYCCS